MVNTRPVTSSLYKNYLQRAEECLNSAREAFQKGEWNSSVINSIHCGISAADALTVLFLGRRSAGERHVEVLSLLQEIKVLQNQDISKKFQQLTFLLERKNEAEYEEKLKYQPDAESALKAAERFLAWVKERTKTV